MSKDSSPTYLHLHASHHADLFEDFCHPPSRNADAPSSSFNSSATAANTNTNTNDPSMIHVPGHFLPFEEIALPQHLMPLNPEDEDGVVPDMHAAFGIQRALAVGQDGERREAAWRDLGLEQLVTGSGQTGGKKREGKKSVLSNMR